MNFRRTPSLKGKTRLHFLFVLLVTLLSGSELHAGEVPVEYDGTRYRTFTCAPEKVQLFWLDPSGKPFHQFSKLQEHLKAEGRKLRFVMNAGIFEEGGIPSGLLVVNGKIERPLNSSPGVGNFFLQPNGVFYVDANGGHVVSTQDYLSRKAAPRYAVQSGPLLLNKGLFHPAPKIACIGMESAFFPTVVCFSPFRSSGKTSTPTSSDSLPSSALKGARMPSSSTATFPRCSRIRAARLRQGIILERSSRSRTDGSKPPPPERPRPIG